MIEITINFLRTVVVLSGVKAAAVSSPFLIAGLDKKPILQRATQF